MKRIAAASGPAVDEPRNEQFDRDYWLAHCEGYRVESAAGRLGLVEEIMPSNSERTELLAVRGGVLGRRLTFVPTSDVTVIVPRAQRLFVNGSEA